MSLAIRISLAIYTVFNLASAAPAAEWVATTTDLIAAEKPGYGGICGVVVERATGDVTINVSDKGMFRSSDQGKTWKKLGEGFKGRTETPGCMLFDPTGKTKHFAAALVYGAPITVTLDEGATWKSMDKKSGHVDWAAYDWTDPELKFVLTLKHESGGVLLASHDGGKTFDELGKGYGPAWIFNGKTAVAAEAKSKDKTTPGIVRTTDGGKSWQSSGAHFAKALPQWHGNKLYWLTESALVTTADEGQTWVKVCEIKNGLYGPVFGKDDKHMMLLTNAGVIESKDAGKSWSTPLALPKDAKGASNMTWLDYDPARDILYTSRMATEMFKLERK